MGHHHKNFAAEHGFGFGGGFKGDRFGDPADANERPRVRRQRGPRGPWEMFGEGFGPGMFGPGFGPGGGRGRGRRSQVRRGDVRTAILDVLAKAEEPLNGYQVIQAIGDRTEGQWRPSPGSIYPTISQLEDEGLIENDGAKAFRLTDAGREHVAEHAERIDAVWDNFAESDDDLADVRHQVKQLMGAFAQVMTTGTPEQRNAAAAVLGEARKKLYSILAED